MLDETIAGRDTDVPSALTMMRNIASKRFTLEHYAEMWEARLAKRREQDAEKAAAKPEPWDPSGPSDDGPSRDPNPDLDASAEADDDEAMRLAEGADAEPAAANEAPKIQRWKALAPRIGRRVPARARGGAGAQRRQGEQHPQGAG